MTAVCSSCKRKTAGLAGTASFPCPKCHKQTINRCGRCRTNAVKYQCAECQFEGPN